MPREFETHNEVEVDATPDQVWDAIATGPGVDAWFMGRTEIEPGEGGTLRTTFPSGFALRFTITGWEPGQRLAYRSEPAEDGSFHAWEILVDGRAGSTVVRVAHSGMLGRDWDDELDAMRVGDAMYVGKLAQYLRHFAGRTAASVQAERDTGGERDAVMADLRARLGLGDDVAPGDRVRLTPDGLAPIEGVVDHLTPEVLGVRSGDGLHRFLYAMGALVIEEHRYGGGAPRDWQGWLDRVAA